MLVAASPRAARADDEGPSDKVRELNRKALEAYDNLEFDKARGLLEQALSLAESSGLGGQPLTARTHLNLGLVYSAGLKRSDEAQAHFEAALKIQPDIIPPTGVFNPETQAIFDAAKSEVGARKPPPKEIVRAPDPAGPGERRKRERKDVGEPGAYFVGLALGTGGGFSKGTVETNENAAGVRYDWTGGFATSPLLAVALEGGYFLRPELMISLEARLQFVTGTSKVSMTTHCMPSCTPPAFAAAATAKATWLFSQGASDGPWKPFITGGLGGGRVRQVVKLDGLTDCGETRNGQCFDTVAGGPLLVVAGGGVAYQVGGGVSLTGGAVARLGVPDVMLNVDIMLGAGLRL